MLLIADIRYMLLTALGHMQANALDFFQASFSALTSNAPYRWQEKLFLQFVSGEWPESVDLPTGAGKTAVLYIWVLALVWSLKTGRHHIPRRLVWVVNRRVVVDQVTAEVENLLETLKTAPELRGLLASASLSGIPLQVGTLRGRRADSGDWGRDPSTPAVVVGTVDMIGSRLLFRGYQSSGYRRPIHAGLLGVDSLIVNDEAHLSPAFAQLLLNIRKMNPAGQIEGKSFRVLLLSATHASDSGKRFEHSPEEDAAENVHFRDVFEAPKCISLHEVARVAIEPTMLRLATEQPAPRTVVFIESPEDAAAFRSRLPEKSMVSVLLTGTMRGFERDGLTNDDVFRCFLNDTYDGPPICLVSTSAGEVGINITCDRMITRMVEADHLLQRFGRLNRFGGNTGEAHVVYSPPSAREPRLIETVAYLRSLGGNISCRSLWNNRPGPEAKSELPVLAQLAYSRVECWAQTCFSDKSVTAVAPWLNGKQDEEGPETELVWREDVKYLTDWDLPEKQLEAALGAYPVLVHEILREPSFRVLNKLRTIAENAPEASEKWLIVVDSDGTPHVASLRDLIEEGRIGNKRLLLPIGLGSLDRGMFRPTAAADGVQFDVAETNVEKKRRRCLISEDGVRWIGEQEPSLPGESAKDLVSFAIGTGFKVPVIIRNPESDGKMLVYFGAKRDQQQQITDVALKIHSAAVAERAYRLALACGVADLADSYRKAGELHDQGKNREVWQRAMGGSMDEPLAKSKRPANLKLIAGYRHELGSLREAGCEHDDLALHLTAIHHKAGRPFFETHQLDGQAVKESKAAASEQARRFGRLQARYGPWGLAYLEAIFKSADGLVSADEGEAASA
ncbi:MAG: type I-U CRISPR-associated helicase/endonuclease Cas3 [Acidobacteriota bacterium]|nr:type I-U CRISPR-associated helicase/endonuclease Cas3 [Acidobacteriota bacterium]